MVEVTITGQVVTAQYGTLSTGTVLRTSSEFAKHLVEDCGAAEYRTTAAKETADESAPARKAALDEATSTAAAASSAPIRKAGKKK